MDTFDWEQGLWVQVRVAAIILTLFRMRNDDSFALKLTFNSCCFDAGKIPGRYQNRLVVVGRVPRPVIDWSAGPGTLTSDTLNIIPSTPHLTVVIRIICIQVWTLTYDDVMVPEGSDNSNPLSDLQGTYAKLVKGSRDEARLIEPGLVFGQLFRRPNSYLNPLPVGVDSGIKFAMIQVCNEQGGYAWNGTRMS